MMNQTETQHPALKSWFPWFALLLVWIIMIVVINPLGEFMVNDDWAYVKCLETFRSTGTIMNTGWGGPRGIQVASGGPSLLVHILIGDLFCQAMGFSLTNLRIAVLTMGILGSFGLLLLLSLAGKSPWLALLGTLTVVCNPLFLTECFTYMSDITFASLAIFALLFLYLGVKKSSTAWVIAGLILVLGSILTRQIGVVILLAFLVTCWLHPLGLGLGRRKMLLLGLVLVLLPWLSYETLLSLKGSTPLTHHQLIYDLLNTPKEKGFLGYIIYIFSNLFLFALAYVGLFVAPLLIGRVLFYLRRRYFQYILIVFAIFVILFELAIVTDLIHPPIIFPRNTIHNFGIGPILLKDTYILKIPRTPVISRPVYYLIVSGAVLALIVILTLFLDYVRKWFQAGFPPEAQENSFLVSLVLLASLLYVGIITLTNFHDRYLIPMLIFLVIFLVLDYSTLLQGTNAFWKITPGFVMIICLGIWSTCNIHDFMEMKRSLKKSHDYALQELRVNPCSIDGGFEFNGYHCYQDDFQPHQGLSWWWVSREDYLITLGPLPGYRVIRKFPFQRYCNPPGAVYVMQPLTR
jgi:hypothetical protein